MIFDDWFTELMTNDMGEFPDRNVSFAEKLNYPLPIKNDGRNLIYIEKVPGFKTADFKISIKDKIMSIEAEKDINETHIKIKKDIDLKSIYSKIDKDGISYIAIDGILYIYADIKSIQKDKNIKITPLSSNLYRSFEPEVKGRPLTDETVAYSYNTFDNCNDGEPLTKNVATNNIKTNCCKCK